MVGPLIGMYVTGVTIGVLVVGLSMQMSANNLQSSDAKVADTMSQKKAWTITIGVLAWPLTLIVICLMQLLDMAVDLAKGIYAFGAVLIGKD